LQQVDIPHSGLTKKLQVLSPFLFFIAVWLQPTDLMSMNLLALAEIYERMGLKPIYILSLLSVG
jgi:hypothetical protein